MRHEHSGFLSYFCSSYNDPLMLNIAIIYGGDSGEYEVSVKSAKQVELNLDRTRYTPFLISIRGKAWTYDGGSGRVDIDKNDFSLTLGGEKILFDMVFNAIHGTPGEDGKMQGYFDLIGLPYTSSGLTTSALTFNKSFCKGVVAQYGTAVAKSAHLFRSDPTASEKIRKTLALPVFIKPNNGGSSVGMTKVNEWEELDTALIKAFNEDDEVLAEEFISGRELTCGVFKSEGKVVALPVTEIISKNDFFDFEAKYKDGLANEVVPAEVPEEVSLECQQISAFLFERLKCKGVVRFDYIYTGEKFYFLEVNTVPGMSEASIVPKMVKAYGWSVSEFYGRLIEEGRGKIEDRR
jgi:D-alanine-D-alanine ligase